MKGWDEKKGVVEINDRPPPQNATLVCANNNNTIIFSLSKHW